LIFNNTVVYLQPLTKRA